MKIVYYISNKEQTKNKQRTMYRITMLCIFFFTMMTQSLGEELTCPAPTTTTTINKIPMDDVKSLTFVQGEMTTSQRTLPISQMTCYGKNCNMAPKEITCKNLGISDFTGDYVWKCDSSMIPGKFSITMADVNCEGYSYKEDPQITEGSCGITFRIGEVSFIPILIIFILLCLVFYCFPELILIALITAICCGGDIDSDSDYDSSFSASTSRR